MVIIANHREIRELAWAIRLECDRIREIANEYGRAPAGWGVVQHVLLELIEEGRNSVRSDDVTRMTRALRSLRGISPAPKSFEAADSGEPDFCVTKCDKTGLRKVCK